MISRLKRHQSGYPMSRFWDMGLVRSTTAFFSMDHGLQRTNEEPTVPALRPIQPILRDGEAILQPPMDNTPNEAPSAPPVRIPHLGHALIFLAITGCLLLLTQVMVLAFAHPHLIGGKPSAASIPPRLLVASEAIAYLATLTLSWGLFPMLWQRSFTNGLQLNLAAARRNALKLIPIGVTLSLIVQAASSLITAPKDIPIENYFHNRVDVWLISIFGVLLAPFFEEVAFRGFLLPAFAIAYDWLTLKRTPAAMAEWHSTNRITPAGWAFATTLTSIIFAGVHGQQVGYAWPVLLLLFTVSLILSFVRLRLRSVFASTLLHASYNFAIFFTLFLGTDGYRHLDKLTH
jgi:uncharacterized protein